MTYKPKPIDTSDVQLPEELESLTELLSENTHEIWAQGRINDGWTYGEVRNDENLEHPCLVPYDQLPESEKAYDRNTAMEALKTIQHLGYQIIPPTSGSGSADYQDEARKIILRMEDKSLDLHALQEIWQTRSKDLWRQVPDTYRILGKRFLGMAENLLAYDVLSEGLETWPRDLQLQQLLGLGLARGGSPLKANQTAQNLINDGHDDSETLSLLGRTHKDLWQKESNGEAQEEQLRLAYEAYETAYNKAGDPYPGINAATLALFRGDLENAHRIGEHVYQVSLEDAEGSEPNYWTEATLGEVSLILGKLEEARTYYSSAGALGKGDFANLNSTRQQARLLLQYLGEAPNWLDNCFALPRIVVFSGHRIDRPALSYSRFPSHLETEVKKRIVKHLNQLGPEIGYACAAAGADILFLEAMLERNAEINIVMPFEKEAYIKTSVDVVPGDDWKDRFERVLAQANSIIYANDYPALDNTVLLEFTSLILDGAAKLRSQVYDTDLTALAVWDGQADDKPGETYAMLQHWKQFNRQIEIVDMPVIETNNPVVVPNISTVAPEIMLDFPQEIRVMFFADVVGFSKLTERDVPFFVQEFVGHIANEIERSPYKPLHQNTWGDAFYFVFSSVLEAAHFALSTRDLIRDTDWEQRGLSAALNMRISLHSGPVYRFTDPMIQKINFSGSHVNRAARIEPITPPGQVYASEHFASLIVASNVAEITCDYVGTLPLAKGYGTFPMYHVRRSHEPE